MSRIPTLENSATVARLSEAGTDPTPTVFLTVNPVSVRA